MMWMMMMASYHFYSLSQGFERKLKWANVWRWWQWQQHLVYRSRGNHFSHLLCAQVNNTSLTMVSSLAYVASAWWRCLTSLTLFKTQSPHNLNAFQHLRTHTVFTEGMFRHVKENEKLKWKCVYDMSPSHAWVCYKIALMRWANKRARTHSMPSFCTNISQQTKKNGGKWQKEQDVEVVFDGENATHSSVKVPHISSEY